MVDLFMLLVMCLVLGFLGFELWALVKWRRIWRVGAALAGLVFLLGVGKLAFELSVDPYSHNMWPFELASWSGIGFFILAALWVVQMVLNHGRVAQ